MGIQTPALEWASRALLVFLSAVLPSCGPAEQLDGSQEDGTQEEASVQSARSERMPRVVLIGIDAMGWDQFSTLLSQGLLPNLESLVDDGVVGSLFNFPGGQKEQWASAATGVRPIVLNPDGWWARTLGNQDRGARIRMPAFNSAPTIPVWQILDSAGARVGVSGWEVSSSGGIDGYEAQFFSLGRRDVPIGASQETLFEKKSAPNYVATTYAAPDSGLFRPPHFYEAVREGIVSAESESDAYFLAAIPSLKAIKRTNETLFLDIKYALVSMLLSKNIARVLLADQELSFVGSIIWGLDPVMHRAQAPPKARQLGVEVYQFIDRMVGDLLRTVDDSTFVFVVSNHAVDRSRGHNKHATDAVFIARGPGINRNQLIVGAGIADIAPTVLRTFGVEIEDAIDGRPMTSIFSSAFLEKNPISKKVSLSSFSVGMAQEPETPIDQSVIIEATLDRMRRIGYSPGNDRQQPAQ